MKAVVCDGFGSGARLYVQWTYRNTRLKHINSMVNRCPTVAINERMKDGNATLTLEN